MEKKCVVLNKNNIENIFSLIPIQEGILYHYLLDKEQNYYLEQLKLSLTGNINYDLFEQAWITVINNNEMLRTVFRWEKLKNPIQIVLKQSEFKINFIDFSNKKLQQNDINYVIEEDRNKGFDLNYVPFRITLCKLNDVKWVMIITHHHIIYDGWSTGIILKEFFEVYHGLIENKDITFTKKAKYKNYVQWLKSKEEHNLNKYWKEYLLGYKYKSIFNNNNSEIDKNKTNIDKYEFQLNQEFFLELSNYAKSHNVTMASILYSGWGILLFHYCNEEDISFGTTVALRPTDILGIENSVGLFINTIPLRIKAKGHEIIEDYIIRVNSEVKERNEYASASLVQIKNCRELKKQEKLFQSIFVFENYPLDAILHKKNSILSIDDYSNYEKINYDFTIIAKLNQDSMNFSFLYNSDLIDNFGIREIERHYLCILQELIKKSNMPLNSLDVVSKDEKRKILYDFNCTKTEFPSELLINEIFERRVLETPDKIAVIYGDEKLTYKDINIRANKLARCIIKNGIIHSDSPIGILVYPSIDMIVGIMAILKAGRAYVPLDPVNPQSRNIFIIKDAEIKLLLTIRDLMSNLPWGGQTIFIEEESIKNYDETNLIKNVNCTNLAYIIYTSGSTGKPKGVMVEHRSVVNILSDLEKRYPVKENDKYLLKTTYTFDVSVSEIFGWFFGKGSLVILEKGLEKDPNAIIDSLKKYYITHLNLVPSMFRYFLESLRAKGEEIYALSNLKYILLSGEVSKPDLVKKFNDMNTGVMIENIYGPTEATIYTTSFSMNDYNPDRIIPIGSPMANVHCYVVDKHNRLQPIGVQGELCISGVGLARGYWKREDLTHRTFCPNPFYLELYKGLDSMNHNFYQRMYKTGDLARWLPDGNIEYLGRNDYQVKIRGFRIELGEIENELLKIEGITNAVVTSKSDNDGNLQLIAYHTANFDIDRLELIKSLSLTLPSYMIPTQFIKIEKMPFTTSGKIDINALPDHEVLTNNVSEDENIQYTDIEQKILSVWKDVLKLKSVGLNQKFFDIGGNSLNLISVTTRINEVLETDIPMSTMFQYPTVREIANYIANKSDENLEENDKKSTITENKNYETDIAIIGMAARFPKSSNIDEFWENLKNGRECITFFSDDELEHAGVESELIKNPSYVKAQGVMNGSEYFDAKFFGYSPREAEIMDPQVRVLHEIVWESLENSGYCPYNYQSSIGIFSCASPNLFWESLVAMSGRAKILGTFASEQLFNKDYISTRIAYKLNLTGPAVSVYTACSSSLVAIHNACQSLIRRECEIAIAGSSTISPLPDKIGYLYQDGMVKSVDGHCRPFDINGSGFVGGTGAAAIVLKRLKDAINDGDSITAVVKASAINNDGNNKVGYTAPNVEGQKKVIKEALIKARIDSNAISYIETHGTATPLGDLVEIEALKQVFNTSSKNYCGIGSVKSNIGHLDCTAGIAGFIKTALSIKHKIIPPTLNLDVANPKLNLIDSPFYIVTEPTIWKNENKPLRAGVSSLGIGGTNAHIILEEPPIIREDIRTSEYELILISAMTQSALENQKNNLLEYLKNNSDVNLSDVAYTLKMGRKHMKFRSAILCKDIVDLIEKLQVQTDYHNYIESNNAKIAYNLNLAREKNFTLVLKYFSRFNVFKSAFENVINVFEKETNSRFIKNFKGCGDSSSFTEDININGDVYINFCIQYAIVKTLIALGIKPNNIYGDIIGELVAIIATQDRIDVELLNLIFIRLKIINNMSDSSLQIVNMVKQRIEKINWKQGFTSCFSNRMNTNLNLEILKSIDFWIENHECYHLDREQQEHDIIINLINNPKELSEKSISLVDKDIEFNLLSILGELWGIGVEINWKIFYEGHPRRRIPIPTYPFEREKYWIEGNPFSLDAINENTSIKKNSDMSQWFYQPLFIQTPINNINTLKNKKCLIFTNGLLFNEKLILKLEKQLEGCIKVYSGTTYNKISNNKYEINIADENDYIELLKNFEDGDFPHQIISLLGVTGESDCEYLDLNSIMNYLNMGYFNLLYLIKAILHLNLNNHLRINVLTDDVQQISGYETINAAKAVVFGICKVIPQEIAFIECKCIDINIPKREKFEKNLINNVINELLNDNSDTVVAFRNRYRYVQRYHKRVINKSSDIAQSKIKEKGVYLITGGLGNVGLTLASHLAKKYNAKLILIGRSEFPRRETWQSIIVNGNLDKSNLIKVKTIINMEKNGGEVSVYSGDIADYTFMKNVVKLSEKKFGDIDGVIHAAGSMKDSLYMSIEDLNRDSSIRQFVPKIQGIMVLYRIFNNKNLDFLTVTSSTSAILGGLGFSAYSSANVFMDYFLKQVNDSSLKYWTSINWEGWKFSQQLDKFKYKGSLNELLMEPEEGIEVFERITNTLGFDQVVVSSGDLFKRIKQWISLEKEKVFKESEKFSTKKSRPDLRNQYIMPVGKIQETIADVFQDFFGYEEIGIEDNFFDLGASSLDMIQITNNLRKVLNINIPVLKLFANPTIKTLAKSLSEAKEEKTVESPIDRLEELSKGRDSLEEIRKLRKGNR